MEKNTKALVQSGSLNRAMELFHDMARDVGLVGLVGRCFPCWTCGTVMD